MVPPADGSRPGGAPEFTRWCRHFSVLAQVLGSGHGGYMKQSYLAEYCESGWPVEPPLRSEDHVSPVR
jgi:hypothetical protein